MPDLDALDQFERLGVAAATVGRRGRTQEGNLLIGYAWRRQPSDDPQNLESHLERKSIRVDVSKDDAIAARYFGDSVQWLQGHGEKRWLLLRRDGLVLAAGQSWYEHADALRQDIAGRFPDAKFSVPLLEGAVNCLGTTEAERLRLQVHCIWLDPNSPDVIAAAPER